MKHWKCVICGTVYMTEDTNPIPPMCIQTTDMGICGGECVMVDVKYKFPYKWYIKDDYSAKNGYKVFSTFACGGGSTMGYKLAGFDVVGMNEIDPKLAECYIENHHPKYSYIEDLRAFNQRNDLPKELYNLDILDGSPPCSTFSMAGSREKAWGVEKKFREGQTKQTLDDLLFVFIETCKKLQSKVCLLENVKGLTFGAAKKYCEQIYTKFDKAGYYVNHWLLNASKMGVPQKRERVFFIAIRKDLSDNINFVDFFRTQPYLDLIFNEKEIIFEKISDINDKEDNLTKLYLRYWDNANPGESVGKFKTNKKLDLQKIATTMTTRDRQYHPIFRRRLNDLEISKEQTYPIDYDFLSNDCNYICGMSVPPVMIAQIATRIKEQWLDKLLDNKHHDLKLSFVGRDRKYPETHLWQPR